MGHAGYAYATYYMKLDRERCNRWREDLVTMKAASFVRRCELAEYG